MTAIAVAAKPSTLSLSAYGPARSTVQGTPLSPDEVQKLDAYWRACKYLALGMIYLQANPLLKEPLKPEHIKNRLLGHWGSSPGLAFIYIHLSRLIKQHGLDMIFMAGPGHGAPGVLGPAYLEGTYSEIGASQEDDDFYVIANAYWEPLEFTVQDGSAEQWKRIVDTALPSPHDFSAQGRPINSLRYTAAPRSIVVLLRVNNE